MNSQIHTPEYSGAERHPPVPAASDQYEPLAILVFDLKSLVFIDVDERAVRRYGYSRDRLLTMTLKDLVPQTETRRVLRFVRDVPETHITAIVCQHRMKDGGMLPVEMHCYKFMYEDKPVMITLTREVSDSSTLANTKVRAPYRHRFLSARPVSVFSRADYRQMLLELGRELARFA